MAPLRIDRPDHFLLRAKRIEERDERTALQMRHRIEIGKLTDAVVPHRRHPELVSGSMARPLLQRCVFLFRTKPQSHEEEGLGRQAHFPINGAAGRTVARESRLAADATSSWLRGFVRKTTGTALTG